MFPVIHGECAECNSPLTMKNRRDLQRKKYCSRECRSRFDGRRRRAFLVDEDRQCKQCGNTFRATFLRHKFCSKKCQTNESSTRWQIRHADSPEGHLRLLVRRQRRTSAGLTVAALVAMFWKQNGKCAVSGVPMTWGRGSGRKHTNISIDRIDSAKGYEIGNVQLVCVIVNLMKHNLNTPDLVSWCRKILEKSDALVLPKAG